MHLVREARTEYKMGPITAALDFQTVHVPSAVVDQSRAAA